MVMKSDNADKERLVITEVKLRPGWLWRDITKAAKRISQWEIEYIARNDMAEVHTTPQMEHERPQFEAWMIKSTACPDSEAKRLLERDASGYLNGFVASAWSGWVGRAVADG